MNIVVIDDSVTNLIVLKSLSGKLLNGNAVGFSDPEAAVTYLEENPAGAIVLDFSMPKLNGVQLIEKIRAMPGHRSTPIIMVTHSNEIETRMCAMRAGATAFLSKPVNAANFKSIVKVLLESHNKDLVAGG